MRIDRIRGYALALSTLATAFLAACSGSDNAVVHTGFRTSDSAGIVIAVNDTPLDSLKLVATVATEPRLILGVTEGSGELLFYQVRDAVRLDNGSIAVANGSPPEIRLFAPDGTFLRRLGRRGQGPGEFEQLLRVFPGEGDTLFVLNTPGRFAKGQILRFTSGDGYVDGIYSSGREVAQHLGGLTMAESPREYFANGALITGAADDPAGRGIQASRPIGEPYRDALQLIWINGDFSEARTIGEFGMTSWMSFGGGGRVDREEVPMSSRSVFAFGGRGTRFCAAGNERPEFHCIDADGSEMVVRWSQPPVPMPQSYIDDWRKGIRASATGPRARRTPAMAETIISGMIIPETIPPVSHMLVDAERRILVCTTDLPCSAFDRIQRFRVFSAEGEMLGLMDIPAAIHADLGPTHYMGLSRNSDGVEIVVIHEVVPAGGH
jgi:hypothetical protein